MVTYRRDSERRASSPRWGTGKQRGQWGRRGCAASPRCPTLLLCPICEPPGIAPAAGSPRRQRAAGGGLLPWGTPPKKNTARLEGAGGKCLQLPRAALGCRKGVRTPCIGQTQPAVSQGIFSRLMFLFLYFYFFFSFKEKHGCSAQCMVPAARGPALLCVSTRTSSCSMHCDVSGLGTSMGGPRALQGFSHGRPHAVGAGCSPRGRRAKGSRRGLHALAGAVRGAGACPNQRGNLIKISDGAR